MCCAVIVGSCCADPDAPTVEMFFRLLAVCHTVIPDGPMVCVRGRGGGTAGAEHGVCRGRGWGSSGTGREGWEERWWEAEHGVGVIEGRGRGHNTGTADGQMQWCQRVYKTRTAGWQTQWC